MTLLRYRLIYLRLAEPEVWARKVRAAIVKYPTMAKASEVLGVSRDTLRLWCRELKIPHGKPGRKKVSQGA